MSPATETACFLGGFVAAEGCFTRAKDSGRFVFSVSLGAVDTTTSALLAEFLGAGYLTRSTRRRSHYDDEVSFQVRRLADLVGVVVPFMDAHLPASYKRVQYERWRSDLLEYWEHGARRRRPCGVDGCEEPRRAHGLCRRHLYQARGV